MTCFEKKCANTNDKTSKDQLPLTKPFEVQYHSAHAYNASYVANLALQKLSFYLGVIEFTRSRISTLAFVFQYVECKDNNYL